MLTRWNEWSGRPLYGFEPTFTTLGALRQEMERVFADSEPGLQKRAFTAPSPRVHMTDHGNELVLRAEVPGMSEKEVQIHVDGGTLTVRGSREVTPPEGYTTHRSERSSIEFSRSFAMPCPIDSEKATAVLKDGILTLTIPKTPEAQPRQISVQARHS